MEKEDRKDLRKDIKGIKTDLFEAFMNFFSEWLLAISSSLLSYGPISKVTKEGFTIIKEYLSILILEKRLVKEAYRKSKDAEIEGVNNFLEYFFDIDEKTYDYYMELVDSLNVAAELKQEYRIKRPRKQFNTIIEGNELYAKLIEPIITERDVLNFLGISEDYWNYIQEDNFRSCFCNYYDEAETDFIGVNYKYDESGELEDIKLFVPYIVDLKTALIYAHTVYTGYLVFDLHRETTKEDEDRILKDAEEKMKEFEIYFREKEKRLLPYQ